MFVNTTDSVQITLSLKPFFLPKCVTERQSSQKSDRDLTTLPVLATQVSDALCDCIGRRPVMLGTRKPTEATA